MAKIIIRNLKNISHLEFEIPVNGVHVLTGINGSGKTTLLTCIQRIADWHAFQRNFKTSSNVQFDNFSSAEITYELNGNSVTYQYKNKRWVPSSFKKSTLLKNVGFVNSIFISSSVDRFYVQNADLSTKGISSATQFIKDSMNEIFETTKYNELKRKKIDGKGRGNGRWNFCFLMPANSVSGQNRYYTEKNFSLGEVLILNTLLQLKFLAGNSLILIDEVELALHPRVQVKFLRFLEKIATDKLLTIIISTHSSSLIKSAKKLIYIGKDMVTGNVNVEYDCYPAIALQNVAITEEVQPDIVFFVEDEYAKYILDGLLNYYFKIINNTRRPIIKILPVGGWTQTIRFAISSSNYLIPAITKVYAILDSDAEADLQAIQLNPNRGLSQQDLINLVKTNLAKIQFLPITPELGLVDLLSNNPQQHLLPLQNLFNEVFDITQIIYDETQRGIIYDPNPRKAAKKRLPFYIERIHEFTNRDTNYIRIKLAEYYALNYCPTHHPEMQQLFNPIFN